MNKKKFMTMSLPYGLSVIFNDKIVGMLSGMTPNLLMELIVLEELDNNSPVYKNWCFEDTKPILYPLSDLTKEIEHKGEKFVPIFELAELWFKCGLNSNYEYAVDQEELEKAIMLDYKIVPFLIIQKLIEWHFDIANLIEKGEAINVNSIEINPYK